VNPFLSLHREMNRLFDDVFRGFDLAPFEDRFFERSIGWPNIEVSETDKDVKVTAELPGLEENDVGESDLLLGFVRVFEPLLDVLMGKNMTEEGR